MKGGGYQTVLEKATQLLFRGNGPYHTQGEIRKIEYNRVQLVEGLGVTSLLPLWKEHKGLRQKFKLQMGELGSLWEGRGG